MNLRKTSSIFTISLKGGKNLDVIISYEAKRAFINYINTHSKAKKHETKCSKIDNITENIEEYFKIKLKEEEYIDVINMINKDIGIFSESIMKQWIRENYNENYIKNKTKCN
jgi:hypothetical protein